MHDWGMWFSMLVMIGVPAALVIVAVAFARWLGDRGGCRSPREILNERYARGEIDREEYLRRRQDITGA